MSLPPNVPPPWRLHKTATTPKPSCPTCHGSKLVLDPHQSDAAHPLGRPIPCPTCNATAETGFSHDITRLTAGERRFNFDNLIADHTNRDAINTLRATVEAPTPHGFIYIHGLLGAGKSRLLITALNHARHHGHTVCYGSAAAIGDYIKDAIRLNDDVRGRLRTICTFPVLGIDDWDRQGNNEFTRLLMQELFDTRYRMGEEKLTIIGSSTPPAETEPYYADRLEAKANATCIALADTSWRLSTSWTKD